MCSSDLESGVAAFRTPEACADSVAAYLAWTPPRPVATDRAGVDDAARALDAASGPTMNEAEPRAVFAALGIRQAGARLVTSADEARSAGVRFPVAAKIVSPDIAHKSEAGGVALDLRDADALAAAADRMRTVVAARHPEARIVGVLVQEMHAGLAEAIVGYKRDPEVGPVVILGVGGVLSEVYRDMAVRIAPVDREEALDMIAEVRGLAPIRGYRNLPRGDLAALADAVCVVSRLALIQTPAISEAEINPLIVKGEGQGVVAVDALIVLRTDENPMGEHA